MEKYIPDVYQKSIYDINYQKLWLQGIKCLLFDLDNTLVPPLAKEPTVEVEKLFEDLKNIGFRLIILSNSPKKRVEQFKNSLDVDGFYSSRKPLSKNYLLALSKYNYTINEVAIIGDQIMTDVLGGNKIGILTIFVNPITKKDLLITKVSRCFEKRIIHKLSKKSLFIKGKYYE